ncbi:tRNA-dihydrouridine synthase, partial [Candidatus Saccharibacteria bacterium 32-49-10]
NGDIADRTQGEALVSEYGVDGIMIGRGVFHNPFCFTTSSMVHNKRQLLDLLSYHLDMFELYSSITKRPFETLKRFFKVYVRDFDGASDLRVLLMNTETIEEVRSIIKTSTSMQ